MSKIKMGVLCEEFINSIRPLKGRYDSLIEDKLIEIKEELDTIIQELENANNLRLYDPNEGGILRGRIDSRKYKLEHWENYNKFLELSCHEKNLNREVGFLRALFNMKSIKYIDNRTRELNILNLLSYESPLIRKKKGNLNDKIGNPFARCDLIGLGEKFLSTLEIKVDPYGQKTRLPFALIESLFYGYILSRHAQGESRSELISEANFCAAEYRRKEIKINEKFQVSYLIGAPKSYFMGYIVNKKTKPKRYNYTNIWLSETRNIETALGNLKGNFPKFGGYLVFSQKKKDVIDKGNFSVPVPVFENWDSPVWNYKSISEVLKDFKDEKGGL